MDINETIKWHEEFIKTIENVGYTEDSSYQAAKVALVSLHEKRERHKGCLHCQSGKPLTTDGGDAELVEIQPLPPINLTTGEEETAGDAYMALQISAFEGELRDYIPIRYCPICGRKLSVSS